MHGSEHASLDHGCSDESSLEAGDARFVDFESKKNDPKMNANANAGANAGASKPKVNGDKFQDSQGHLESEESIYPSDCEIREFPQTQDSSSSLVLDGNQIQKDGHLLHENAPEQMTQDTFFDNACALTGSRLRLIAFISIAHTIPISRYSRRRFDAKCTIGLGPTCITRIASLLNMFAIVSTSRVARTVI